MKTIADNFYLNEEQQRADDDSKIKDKHRNTFIKST